MTRYYHCPMDPWHPVPVSGFLDFFTGGSDDQCRAARDRQTAALDAQTEDLQRAWKPADLYPVPDMTKMRDEVMALLLSASRACDAAAASATTYKPTIRQAQSWLYDKQKESLEFTSAIHEANRQGIRVIQSAGFKRWVITSMTKASLALGHVAYMNCIKPGLLAVLEQAIKVAGRVVAFGKAMIRFTVAAGEAVLDLPDTVGTLWKYTKVAGLACLAYYALRPRAPSSNPARRRRRR